VILDETAKSHLVLQGLTKPVVPGGTAPGITFQFQFTGGFTGALTAQTSPIDAPFAPPGVPLPRSPLAIPSGAGE
jgi:hypothetical protein